MRSRDQKRMPTEEIRAKGGCMNAKPKMTTYCMSVPNEHSHSASLAAESTCLPAHAAHLTSSISVGQIMCSWDVKSRSETRRVSRHCVTSKISLREKCEKKARKRNILASARKNVHLYRLFLTFFHQKKDTSYAVRVG